MALSTEGILRNFTAEDFTAVSEGGGGEGGGSNNAAYWFEIGADGRTVTVNFEDPVDSPSNLRNVNWGDGTPDDTDIAVDQVEHWYETVGASYVITATNVAGEIYDQSIYLPPPAVITAIDPPGCALNAPDTAITVTGTNFQYEAVIRVGITDLPTTQVSATELTTVIPADFLTQLTTYNVRVVNPGSAPSDPELFVVGLF